MNAEVEKKFEALKTFVINETIATADEIADESADTTYNEGYNTFEIAGCEFKVLTDSEADEAARDDIVNSLWAFNPDFILSHTDFWEDLSANEAAKVEKALEAMTSKLCESANPLVKAMIADFDEFVEDAIDTDGRGHFISWYDGEENESGDYFIYRTN